ncbi:E3 ubiquitin-protein ligase TRIM7-like [Paroedura picta]|uniref:E3 ubiquitin-protein ligase TRIM7-like n=1 Tax=Paroedura picta TaxID=143630 RepID=UPI0040569A4A
MASNCAWRKLQEEATCFICWKYFANPFIVDCGHTFCMDCVSQCWKEFPEDTACPQCRAPVEKMNCRPNAMMTSVVGITKQMSSQVKGEEGGGGKKFCKKHPEPSEARFCVKDQVIFCKACAGPEKHKDHQVASLEEAAKFQKDKYSSYIEDLKEERAKIMKLKFHIAEWDVQLKRNSVIARGKLAAGFRKLHDFLDVQEGHLLMCLEPVPRERVERRNSDILAHLFLEICALEDDIRQLEKVASKPALELVAEGMKAMHRCQKRARVPIIDVSQDLKWEFWRLMETTATMEFLVDYFRDTLHKAFAVSRVQVTLDRTSNHPRLLVSRDGHSVKWQHTMSQVCNTRARFEKLCCVLGKQGFTMGCHSWDVTVEGPGDWAVGVAKHSVRRKGDVGLCVEEGIFAVGKIRGEFKVLSVPNSLTLLWDAELKLIRVSLNCSAGQVNFYDVRRAMRVFGFTGVGLFQETFLPFFWLDGESKLIINKP